MATLYASTFTRRQTLSHIEPTLLHGFLKEFSEYLKKRGILLNDDLDIAALSQVLMEPGPDTPRGLIDALFCIKEMSIPSAEHALLDEAEDLGIQTNGEITLAEVALGIWIRDRDALLRRHAELAMLKVRSFEYFSSAEEEDATLPDDQNLQSLERSLDIFFANNGHGSGVRVHVYPRGHEMWFLIRRGDLYRREATLENGQSGSIAFRPEKYDLVIFNQMTHELGINGKNEKVRNEYRKQFGYYLFGRDNQFAGVSKYSLEPLREQGIQSLNVIDAPGIQWVKLTDLQYTVRVIAEELRSCKAPNLFEHFQYKNFAIPSDWELKRATFKVRFEDNPTPRSVTIKPPNVALYSRDEDTAVVEEWLIRRGFIFQGQVDGSEQSELRIPMS